METPKTNPKISKEFTGKVVSVKMNNTVIVAVTQITRHKKYKKTIKHNRRFAVHNENKDIKVGDQVKIVEVRPISRTKHFTLSEKIEV
jgi:small subunit ribosomal protein S17